MASTPEGRVKSDVDKILKKHDVWYFKPATGGYGRSGVPDYVLCVNGRFFGLEAKAGNNQPTGLQVKELRGIFAHGGVVMVVREDNLDLLEEIIVELLCDTMSDIPMVGVPPVEESLVTPKPLGTPPRPVVYVVDNAAVSASSDPHATMSAELDKLEASLDAIDAWDETYKAGETV